jgi:Rrf2 family transcriptional regulator, iron-sulfur cluster assembly transcription factor
MLSNASKYAIRAVVYLALNEKKGMKIGIKQIAKELGIPTPFLSKILQNLAKHKLLSSTKGPHGGFGFDKSPYDIKLMDIVEIIDGLENFNSCILGLKECTKDNLHCSIHHNYATIREQLKQLFLTENIGLLTEHIKEKSDSLVL